MLPKESHCDAYIAPDLNFYSSRRNRETLWPFTFERLRFFRFILLLTSQCLLGRSGYFFYPCLYFSYSSLVRPRRRFVLARTVRRLRGGGPRGIAKSGIIEGIDDTLYRSQIKIEEIPSRHLFDSWILYFDCSSPFRVLASAFVYRFLDFMLCFVPLLDPSSF